MTYLIYHIPYSTRTAKLFFDQESTQRRLQAPIFHLGGSPL
ncbi:hypothetical protein CBM2634_B160266 [Cupriavidus taiwanensis]|uniref:Uncharacterized protein n=1 Tax=Cupriavidus taiwanensis TaxID=164546 RepID=A0A375J8D6_9BURK|nr:hypothetical protein CBM2634_B160266 [Cupriavidus taiwanensis]